MLLADIFFSLKYLKFELAERTSGAAASFRASLLLGKAAMEDPNARMPDVDCTPGVRCWVAVVLCP